MEQEPRWLRLLVVPYWKAIKSVRLSVTDFGFNGSFARLALPEFKTLSADHGPVSLPNIKSGHNNDIVRRGRAE